ncbi:unnamed protein product [Candidula unifasciata]|uniref:Cadherin domain-containing protein n=1 Tax=Candidula unifasciata TaxID=100452 RepID=A0A8S3YSP6_9EUPU|nr:unnamed protein product [Candidula unifasciata]
MDVDKARSDLRFSILPDGNDNSNLFKIDAVSGNITFSKRVDRESVCQLSRVCEFSFGVAVSGGNNFFRRIPVKVAILDLNDNNPVFPDPATVEIRISEDAPENFTHPLPVASDADSSVEFGISSYTIEPPSDTFRLDISRNFLGVSQVSLVVSQKLDREVTDNYQLVIVAKDGGQPSRSATLNVNVIVGDVNDNRPQFVQKTYNVEVTEDATLGDNIITVSASDDDIGDNGKVVYSLSSLGSGNAGKIVDKININTSTGEVTLVQTLVNGEYRFWVDAHDLGSPRRYDQTLVSLTVLDTMNNQPTVRMNPVQKDNLPFGWLLEGLEINTVVAVVSVDDPDSGNNGEVTCQSQNSNFLLESLESRRYKLMIGRTLDREVKTTYMATVTCRDQGNPSLSSTASMLITLVDVNDNSPRFPQESYLYNIVENNMKGDTVAIITASDKDDGQNAVVEYKLVNDGGNFSISPSTGIITANIRFDRERVAQYTFHVVAVDHGQPSLSGTTTVTVNILDLNDNDPIFSLQEYNFRLYENKKPGSLVGNISVTDPDLGVEGTVSLSLKPADDKDGVPFAIDHQGKILTLQKFDREHKNMYSFVVVATDNGFPKRSSSVRVSIDILDINDNAPVFVFPSERNYSTTVNMPVQKDAVILHVDVYDPDDNRNGLVTHSIVDNNASQLFTIETLSGHLVARTNLNNPNMAGTYYITINATDQGSPPLWQTRTLHLTLLSDSTSSGEVIADQNLLIVACIVCFTVIISGVVLVAICLVRSQDRRKKIHYHASVCRELAVDCDTGLTSQCGQQYSVEGSDTSRHGQDDFNSTASTETGTGAICLQSGIDTSRTVKMKTSRLRANSCSVRFDPCVTDIYDQRHPLRSQPNAPPIRGRSSSVPCSALPQHQPYTGELKKHRIQHTPVIHQQTFGQSQLTHSYQPNSDKGARSHYPNKRPILPSLSSLGDSCNEDSDLNTTTSGSYSVISDKTFHTQGPERTQLRDWQV